MSENTISFKDYVDDFVSKNTKYSTAEELLNSKVKVGVGARLFPNIQRIKFRDKFTIKQKLDFDPEDLLEFLRSYMKVFPGYFNKWDFYDIDDSGRFDRYDEHIIACGYWKYETLIAQIQIIHENNDAQNETRLFYFDVSPRAIGVPSLSSYKCAVKAVPILSAAVDYYLNVYLKNSENRPGETDAG